MNQMPQVPHDLPINITVDARAVNTILTALAELPHKVVARLVQTIQVQADAQVADWLSAIKPVEPPPPAPQQTEPVHKQDEGPGANYVDQG